MGTREALHGVVLQQLPDLLPKILLGHAGDLTWLSATAADRTPVEETMSTKSVRRCAEASLLEERRGGREPAGDDQEPAVRHHAMLRSHAAILHVPVPLQ